MKVDFDHTRRYVRYLFEDCYPLSPIDVDSLRRDVHDYIAACLGFGGTIECSRQAVRQAVVFLERYWNSKRTDDVEKLACLLQKMFDEIDEAQMAGKALNDIIVAWAHRWNHPHPSDFDCDYTHSISTIAAEIEDHATPIPEMGASVDGARCAPRHGEGGAK